MEIICNKCGAVIRKPDLKTIRDGEIEHTYFLCPDCGEAYRVSTTDKHLRKLIGDYDRMSSRLKEGNCTKEYEKRVQIIKDGGYATSHSYVSNLCSIIERWNLTQYDTAEAVTSAPAADAWYRVRKSWGDVASQVGAFKVLENAKACADEHPGFYVFDPDGVKIYTPKTSVAVPFLVRVSIRDLNIRRRPGHTSLSPSRWRADRDCGRTAGPQAQGKLMQQGS